MKNSGIGGQAVMEGVMMQNDDIYAIAVRKNDGEITVEEFKNQWKFPVLRKIPIIRGVYAFVASLKTGMKTLTYSASFFEDEEETKRKENLSEEEKAKEKRKEKREMTGTIAFSVVFAIALFVILPYGLSLLCGRFLSSLTAISLIEGFIRLAVFLAYVALISRVEDIKRVFMYHGAEHKCINCLEHGQILDVEHVRNSSPLHKRCGTSFLLIVMVISIIVFSLIRIESVVFRLVFRLLLIPVIAGISYEFLKLAGKSENPLVNILSKPGLWLQRLTTAEPTDDMIEVGIASVEAVFDWRNFLNKEFGMELLPEELEEEPEEEKEVEDETGLYDI